MVVLVAFLDRWNYLEYAKALSVPPSFALAAFMRRLHLFAMTGLQQGARALII
jgi:hypothetical protein